MKSSISQIKSSIECLQNRLAQMEKRTLELEVKPFKILQTAKKGWGDEKE
jgi:hypothetical protein